MSDTFTGPLGQAVTRKPDGSLRVGSTVTAATHWGPEVRQRILDLTAAKLSAAEIAISLGCSSRMVQRVRRDAREAGKL